MQFLSIHVTINIQDGPCSVSATKGPYRELMGMGADQPEAMEIGGSILAIDWIQSGFKTQSSSLSLYRKILY